MCHFFSLINDLPLFYHYLIYFISINLIEKMYDFFSGGCIMVCGILHYKNLKKHHTIYFQQKDSANGNKPILYSCYI